MWNHVRQQELEEILVKVPNGRSQLKTMKRGQALDMEERASVQWFVLSPLKVLVLA